MEQACETAFALVGLSELTPIAERYQHPAMAPYAMSDSSNEWNKNRNRKLYVCPVGGGDI
jgi:hypothetical protein